MKATAVPTITSATLNSSADQELAVAERVGDRGDRFVEAPARLRRALGIALLVIALSISGGSSSAGPNTAHW